MEKQTTNHTNGFTSPHEHVSSDPRLFPTGHPVENQIFSRVNEVKPVLQQLIQEIEGLKVLEVETKFYGETISHGRERNQALQDVVNLIREKYL